MILRKYKDFNECFNGLNKYILTNPTGGVMDGCRLQIPNLIIEIDSTKCDEVDLGLVGYKKAKWKSLLRSYIDLDKLEAFYKGLQQVTGNSYSFDFKSKAEGNGGCIKSMVLTRRGKKRSKWSELHVMWRTCQLETKFAGDLIMISRIIQDAPNCDISHIVFHMPQAFMSAMYVSYLATYVFHSDVEGLRKGSKDPDAIKFYNRILSYDKWKDPNHRLCKRATVAKFQNHYRSLAEGVRPDPVTIEDCRLPFTKD